MGSMIQEHLILLENHIDSSGQLTMDLGMFMRIRSHEVLEDADDGHGKVRGLSFTCSDEAMILIELLVSSAAVHRLHVSLNTVTLPRMIFWAVSEPIRTLACVRLGQVESPDECNGLLSFSDFFNVVFNHVLYVVIGHYGH